jgi:hypothetical protein
MSVEKIRCGLPPAKRWMADSSDRERAGCAHAHARLAERINPRLAERINPRLAERITRGSPSA